MVCATYTLRDRLLVIHCGLTVVARLRMPPMEEGMAQIMFQPFDGSFHSYPGAAAVGRPGDRTSVVEAAASPSCMASQVWMRGTTRTRQRVLPLGCMCARPNSHVPTGYTSLVSLETDRGDGLQVIPCRVGCVPCGVIAGPLMQDRRACWCQV